MQEKKFVPHPTFPSQEEIDRTFRERILEMVAPLEERERVRAELAKPGKQILRPVADRRSAKKAQAVVS